jgi:hypothetical protein
MSSAVENLPGFPVRAEGRSSSVLVAFGAALGGLLFCGCGDVPPASMAVEVPALQRSAETSLERAAALRDRAKRFDQEATLDSLGANRKNGEYYRFDERIDEARPEGGAAPVPPARDHVAGLRFEFEGDDTHPLVPAGGTARVREGVLEIDHGEGSFLVAQGELALARDDVGAIEIRASQRKGTRLELNWSRRAMPDLASSPHRLKKQKKDLGRIRVDTVADGTFHVYRVDAKAALRHRLKHGDRIRTIVLIPSDVDGDRVEIDYIRFVTKRESYAAHPFGVSHETLGTELRSVLYVNSPLTLAYRLRIPENQPRLSFGVGILENEALVRFTVSLANEGEEVELFAQEVRESERWEDAQVDLARWAGRNATLRFRAEGPRRNVAFWSNPLLSSAPRERFNVILLLEDTLRADRLSLYGHQRETSPEKARWAQQGVVFEHAFSQATKTRPSCPSLMTSLYPSATGVWYFTERLDESYLTLAEILRSQGYQTGAFIQNGNAGPIAGLHQGYSYLFDSATVPDTPDLFGEQPLRWIDERGGRNFFLYLHARDPHGVYDPPEPFDRWYREKAPGGTVVIRNSGKYRLDPKWVKRPTREGRRLLYDGEVRHNDHWFGRFLERLGEAELLDHTLIVALADHGEHLGERDLWEHHPPGYTQTIRVPLAMVHPSLLPRGRRIAQPVQLLDVMPTVLELSEVERGDLLMQGDSLLSLVRGERPEYWKQRLVVSEEVTVYNGRTRPDEISGSVFTANLHVLHSVKLPETEVFDYVRDPNEQEPLGERGLVAELEAVVVPFLREMKQLDLEIWRSMRRDREPVIQSDPEVRERLRALGYVE